MAFSNGVDLVGRDLQQIFDTSLEACVAACVGNEACTAITYNARNGSCFPKTDVTGSTPFKGAFSGVVLKTDAQVLARGLTRAKAADFLAAGRLDSARALASGMGRKYDTGATSENALRAGFLEAVAAGDAQSAQRLEGALIVLTDAPDLWADYARRELETDGSADTAISAALNGYLRAGDDATAAEALVVLSQGLESDGSTREMISALTLATRLTKRDDVQAALDDAIAKYGFRITGNRVEVDGADPRICADFSEDLARTGVDYASYVQLPRANLSVEPEGSQICVSGLERGARYTVTFRKGLPSAAGEALAKDVAITGYIRDRGPQVSFAGQAYILPRGADQGLPVQTVNLEHLDLRILRVSDRNLVAAIRNEYMGRPLDQWDLEQLSDALAETVWTGTADVTMDVNKEITTRLPVQEVTGALGPGVYALQASVPGADPYETPPAMQWFVISDLGMATWSGTDGLTVAVRHLSDATPAKGATVQLVSRANEILAKVPTDDQGVAHFDPAVALRADNGAPAMVSVTQGDDMSFLSLTDAEFDLSDRGVAGMPPAPPIDVFLTTDRGAYRAGEVIHATALARDTQVAGLAGVPLTAVLTRPDGVEYLRQLIPDVGAGGHVADLALGGNVPRGTWRVDVYADPKAEALASAKVLVEDFLPERIDFTLALADGILPAADLPPLALEARYLFGAPGAGLAYEGDIRLTATSALPGYEGYQFGRYDEEFSPLYGSIDSGVTDDEGRTDIGLTLPEGTEQAMRPLQARVVLRVREGSGRPVERELTRTVMPDRTVLGIRPAFDGSVPEGSPARFSLIALGPDGRPVAARAHWTVNRIERHYQWYAVDGRWNWEPTVRRTRVAQGDVALNGKDPAEVSARTTWGEYEIVLEAGQGEDYAATAVSFDAGWYAPADTVASPDRLDLSLDKPSYKAGDTAHLRVVPAADGVVLVSVLSNRVVAMKTVAVKAGATVIDLPVTDEWGGGVYVTATAIRPLEAKDAPARAPVRALGLSYARVDPGNRQLQVAFDVPEASAPRAPLPVALKVANAQPGQTVYATIAATDLGILNLTAFKSPDPVGNYFGQRRLGVGLRDLYGRLIDGRAGIAGAIRSGGDAAMGLSMNAPPPTEELVAYFSGPLTADADGVIRTAFDMPAFNGTVRLNAVVWSATAVGQASQDVLVRDPVVVTASVPRFMAPGDTSRAFLEVVHARGPAGRMALTVTSDQLTVGAAPGTVTLADQGKATIEVPLSAPQTEGVTTLRVTLTTPDGTPLEKVLTIPVERNDPAVARQSRFDLAGGKTFTLDQNVFAGMVPGTGYATIAAGPMARFDTPALLAALDRYPYGCTEQITSKALPLLYLSSVAEAMRLVTPADLPGRINGAIGAVLTNQDSSGAFGLWSAESGDGWLDAYVTDFLSRAKKAGYAVPDKAFRAALDNLRNQVNYAPDFDATSNGGGGLLAYQLMVLAREGAAAVGDLRYYADVKGDDFATPIAAAQLGAALAAYGDQTRADAMFARAARMVARAGDTTQWRDDYGTGLRDMAAVLTLAAEAGSSAVDRDKVGAALAERIAKTHLSTQEATWSLLAANALIDRPGAEALTLNGQKINGPMVGVLDAQAADPVSIANTGSKPAVMTLTTFGVPEVPEPAGGTGWAIRRSYYTLEGAVVDPAQVAQGTRLVAVDDVTPHGRQEARLMVNDPLPAGFEIDNPNLIRAGDLASLDWLGEVAETRMTQFRQDRFLAAVDWHGDEPFRLAYIVRAVSPGTFHLPAASVEDMYRPDQRAHSDAGTVVIR